MSKDCLEKRLSQLELDMKEVRTLLRIKKLASAPHTTQNRVILREGEPFWAFAYRNDNYGVGEWSVRFTIRHQNAELANRVEVERDEGETKIWELRLPLEIKK